MLKTKSPATSTQNQSAPSVGGRPLFGHLHFETVVIDPIKAQQILDTNVNNRPTNRQAVKQYKEAMLRGEWSPAQPLLFDERGHLIDGQHRLKALVEAHATIEFTCISGYTRDEVWGKIDSGRSRSRGDWLGMADEKEAELLSTCLIFVYRFHKNIAPFSSNVKPSVDQMFDMLDGEAARIRDSIAAVPVTISRVFTRSHAVFLHYVFSMVSKEEADRFFNDLARGTGLEGNDPVYRLREELLANRARPHKKLNRHSLIGMVIRTWNGRRRGMKWVDGKTGATRTFTQSSKFQFPPVE